MFSRGYTENFYIDHKSLLRALRDFLGKQEVDDLIVWEFPTEKLL